MEKTTVDIISGAFSVYHCFFFFFFLDLPLMVSDVDAIWPYAVCSETARNLLSIVISFSC